MHHDFEMDFKRNFREKLLGCEDGATSIVDDKSFGEVLSFEKDVCMKLLATTMQLVLSQAFVQTRSGYLVLHLDLPNRATQSALWLAVMYQWLSDGVAITLSIWALAIFSRS